MHKMTQNPGWKSEMRSGGQKTELPEPNDLVFLADQGLLVSPLASLCAKMQPTTDLRTI